MTDETKDAGEEPTETVSEMDAAGDRPEIACGLTAERTERRRAWMRENLLSHLDAVEEREDGVSLVFDRSRDAYDAVAELAWKESRCCAWATFEVELPPAGDTVRWNARSERDGGVEFFGDALRETLREFEGAPAVE